MVLNQLFIDVPPIALLNRMIKAFGLNDINDTREFSQIDIDKNNTLMFFKTIESELRECYIPCKQKVYIDNIKNITHKEAITILRQILKIHNYDLQSKEKFIKSIKYMVYKITTKQNKAFDNNNKNKNKNKKQNRQDIIIIFD